jgi:hypothetical protein
MSSTDAIPVPRKNVAYRVTFAIYKNDGTLITGASALDSEVSKDGGTFADCTNEATEIATSSGVYYLDLTSTEMNADCVAVIVKTSSTGAVIPSMVFYPQETGDIKVDVTSNAGTAITAASGRQEVNVSHWSGTAVATVDTAGYPKVTIKSGTGAGEVSLSSGIASVNATQINGSATAAARLALSAAHIVAFTVDTGGGFSPTSTQYETNLTEATADHYKDRVVLWTTGAMADQIQLVTANSLVSGRVRFTVSAGTEAPANGDTAVLL